MSASKTINITSKPFLRFQVNLYKNFNLNELEKLFSDELVLSTKSSLIENFYHHLAQGDLFFYKYLNKDIEAISSYKIALKQAVAQSDEILICEAIKKILYIHRISFLVDNETYLDYLKMYRKYAYDELENTYLQYFDLNFRFKNYYVDNWDEEIENYLITKANNISTPIYLRGKIKQLVGFYYEMIGDYSHSEKLYGEAINHFGNLNIEYTDYDIKTTLVYQAILEVNKDNPREAIQLLHQAKSDKMDKLFTLNRMYIDYWKSVAHSKMGDYKSAFESNSSYEYLRDSLNEFKYSTLLTELETKYQTAEKEKQILIEQQRATTNRNWLIAAIIALFLGSGIAILLQKNTTKQRKLAEQGALLEQQKVETLLKEQELVSLDAMIAGQEKERTKVANELHDDLGSLMATVKLHFDNVKVDEKDPAMKNAQALLEKAYQKIRGMAHAKNSGVMANQGLLPAVKKMAKTINETNALEVTVEDFGLADRMENSLELTLFRILQELVTNILKHAEATKASIQFTQHEDKLNIIVEDNGKGFDISAIKRSSSGMGLGTIEKRIEHLEGSFTVDSVLSKGTSILIDIPV